MNGFVTDKRAFEEVSFGNSDIHFQFYLFFFLLFFKDETI